MRRYRDGEGEIRMGDLGKEMDELRNGSEMDWRVSFLAPGYAVSFGSTSFASTKMVLRWLGTALFRNLVSFIFLA